jgi:uncharacterized protein (DUF305 family)
MSAAIMGTTKTWLVWLAALALTALAAGCGSDTTSVSGNATDAAFITDMTAHHQGAIAVAEMAHKRAEHPEVRNLADDIISLRKGQISVMKRIGDDMRGMGMHDGGHMGMSRSQMGMNIDLPRLRHAKPFDRAFIDMMVPQRQGATAMARKELADGSQPALRAMAQNMIESQTKDIAQMRRLRK